MMKDFPTFGVVQRRRGELTKEKFVMNARWVHFRAKSCAKSCRLANLIDWLPINYTYLGHS